MVHPCNGILCFIKKCRMDHFQLTWEDFQMKRTRKRKKVLIVSVLGKNTDQKFLESLHGWPRLG